MPLKCHGKCHGMPWNAMLAGTGWCGNIWKDAEGLDVSGKLQELFKSCGNPGTVGDRQAWSSSVSSCSGPLHYFLGHARSTYHFLDPQLYFSYFNMNIIRI